MSRLLFLLVALTVVAYSVGQYVPVGPLKSDDTKVPVNPVLVAEEPTAGSNARPKRQFGLGFLLGSALSGVHGYKHTRGAFGPYGVYSHHGHVHRNHYHGGYYRRPYGYGGFGYGR